MENYKRADYNSRLSRYVKIFCFRFCGIFPMTGFFRAKIYKLLGGFLLIRFIQKIFLSVRGRQLRMDVFCFLIIMMSGIWKSMPITGVKFILGGMYISEAMPYSQNRWQSVTVLLSGRVPWWTRTFLPIRFGLAFRSGLSVIDIKTSRKYLSIRMLSNRSDFCVVKSLWIQSLFNWI